MRKHIFRRPFLPGNGVLAFRGAKERIQQPYGVVYPWVGKVILASQDTNPASRSSANWLDIAA